MNMPGQVASLWQTGWWWWVEQLVSHVQHVVWGEHDSHSLVVGGIHQGKRGELGEAIGNLLCPIWKEGRVTVMTVETLGSATIPGIGELMPWKPCFLLWEEPQSCVQ